MKRLHFVYDPRHSQELQFNMTQQHQTATKPPCDFCCRTNSSPWCLTSVHIGGSKKSGYWCHGLTCNDKCSSLRFIKIRAQCSCLSGASRDVIDEERAESWLTKDCKSEQLVSMGDFSVINSLIQYLPAKTTSCLLQTHSVWFFTLHIVGGTALHACHIITISSSVALPNKPRMPYQFGSYNVLRLMKYHKRHGETWTFHMMWWMWSGVGSLCQGDIGDSYSMH